MHGGGEPAVAGRPTAPLFDAVVRAAAGNCSVFLNLKDFCRCLTDFSQLYLLHWVFRAAPHCSVVRHVAGVGGGARDVGVGEGDGRLLGNEPRAAEVPRPLDEHGQVPTIVAVHARSEGRGPGT